MKITPPLALCAFAVAAGAFAPAALAQDASEQRRTRVALGPQLVPSYPGSDSVSLRPFIDLSRTRGDTPFEFEAADESFGFPLLRHEGFAIGPSLGFQGSRTAKDVGAPVAKVRTTFEAGGFVQYQLTPSLRARAELRKGIGGHKGWIGTVGADYVARDADQWLFSVGPRVTIGDDRYHRAYFGVSAADAQATGLPRFVAQGGVQAVGLTTGLIYQFTPTWGISSYAKYDRLVGDAADSPIVRRFGSRNQFSGGLALTYTFGANRD